MFKKEWTEILKKPKILIVFICIAFIPAIYAGVYLSSMWDTYGHENQIPVAVVNKDRTINFNDNNVNLGDKLSSRLKKTNTLRYDFVNQKKANDGLKKGNYYMVIEIPENFSNNSTTLLTKNPKQSKLIYKTNTGLNFFASQVSRGTINEIKNSISNQITTEYLTNILKNMGMKDDHNAKLISQPIEIEKNDISKTKFNGIGMAPFAISIGIYVGCISMSFMYDMFKPKKKPQSAISWWFSKASVLFVVTGLQSLFTSIVIFNGLGLTAIDPIKTAMIMFLTGLTFMSCVFALNVILGAFGKYLVTILLILQLGGSGGVYPIETANTFTKVTNPFLPMTYGIHALKETISIGESIMHDSIVMISIIILLNIMIIIKMYFDKKIGKFQEDLTID